MLLTTVLVVVLVVIGIAALVTVPLMIRSTRRQVADDVTPGARKPIMGSPAQVWASRGERVLRELGTTLGENAALHGVSADAAGVVAELRLTASQVAELDHALARIPVPSLEQERDELAARLAEAGRPPRRGGPGPLARGGVRPHRGGAAATRAARRPAGEDAGHGHRAGAGPRRADRADRRHGRAWATARRNRRPPSSRVGSMPCGKDSWRCVRRPTLRWVRAVRANPESEPDFPGSGGEDDVGPDTMEPTAMTGRCHTDRGSGQEWQPVADQHGEGRRRRWPTRS